jgi:signal peptidase I
MWMLGSLIITSFAWSYTRKNVIECYKIVTESMKPEVLKGDRVIVDKTAYKRVSPKVGDVVVYIP